MRKKQIIIESFNPSFAELYLTNADVAEIMKWKEIDAELVWNTLLDNIRRNVTGLYKSTCPQCLYADINFSSCQECTYAKNHGVCDSDYEECDVSDWNIITQDHQIHRKFSNEVYLQIIEGIE